MTCTCVIGNDEHGNKELTNKPNDGREPSVSADSIDDYPQPTSEKSGQIMLTRPSRKQCKHKKVFYAPGPQHNDPRCRWARLPDSPCPVFAPPYSVFRLQTCSTRWDTALPSTCHTTQPAQSKCNTGYILPLYQFTQTTDCCPPPRVSKRIRPLIPDLAITKPFVRRNGKV